MYVLDSNSKIPLFIQLYQAIKKDITSSYEIGDKLFSIRKMCNRYNLSKTTVSNAYSQLVIEGYIDSKNRSSYFVIANNYKNIDSSCFNEMNEIKIEKVHYDYDFYPARQEKNSFPLKIWKRLSNKSLDANLDYCDNSQAKGERGLIEEISKYLSLSRKVKCEASQIIVCHGFDDSMMLLTKILKKTHKSLALECPGYKLAQDIFLEQGYCIDKIALNENGIVLKQLEKTKSKVLYLTPSHQFPTGISIPISNRLQILAWAKKNKAFVIEDDYDSELSYYNRPIPSLQGLDENDSVIYLGTFSKSLSPSLRISYMVLPKQLLKVYSCLSDSKHARVSLMLQNTLSLFMKEGFWDKHQRKVRTLNKRKHKIMKELLLDKLKDTAIIKSEGIGLSLVIDAKDKMDFNRLYSLALKEKIKIYFVHDVAIGTYDGIRMGFGGLKEEDFEKAIERFSKIWFLCLNK